MQRDSQLMEARELLHINLFFYYPKKICLIITELTLYLASILLFISAFAIPTEPIHTSDKIDESVTIFTTIHIKEVSEVLVAIKVITFIFSILFFIFGIVTGKIRKKNRRIKKAYELIDESLKLNEITI